MKVYFLSWAVLTLCLLCAVPVFPQTAPANLPVDYDTARLTRNISAVRVTGPINLDGRLDEAAWDVASPASDFLQWQPDSGAPASQATEARFLYDDDNLYVGIICFDSAMDQLTVNSITDDFQFGESDNVAVLIDSLNDDRSGFGFVVNPGGGRRDGQVANNGQTGNWDWDGVWDFEITQTGDAWIVEMRIPFKTLRFSNSELQEWGVNLTRGIRRLNEESMWSPIPVRYRSTRMSLAGTLGGLEGIRQGQNLKVKPFASSGLTQTRNSDPAITALDTDYDFDGGVDIKYGLTPSLTLDATYRTDFAQVEVDQQQVNLTRFNLFFPEKREFFLENSGTFQFGPGGNLVPFFSRRIGLGSDGNPIPIVGGGRLTGQVGPYDVGILTMKTESTDLAPSNDYVVGRLKRNLLANSWIGGLVTSRNSSAEGDYNRVYGADAHFQFYERLEFDSYILQSAEPGVSDKAQARRFQTAWRDDEFIVGAEYNQIQTNFNPEVGFVRRRDMSQYAGQIAWNPLIESRDSIRNLFFNGTFEYFENGSTEKVETRTQILRMGVQFQNSGLIDLRVTENFDRLSQAFAIRPDISIPAGDYQTTRYRFSVRSSTSASLGGRVDADWGEFWNGDRKSIGWRLNFRPNYRINLELDYNHNRVALPTGKFTTDLVGARFTYAFTARAFLNAFVQYNADRHQVSSNIRFNIIHRPLSDLFIVYNDIRDTQNKQATGRALIVKFTNLFNF